MTSEDTKDCAASAKEFARWRLRERVITVDTRSAEEFRRFHIPGSLNLQVRELKTKSYLHDHKILLVGEGYRRLELRDACATLRTAGFDFVRFLDGGLTAWVGARGPLAGTRGGGNLDPIPPQAFEAEVLRGEWVVIDVSEQSDPAIHDLTGATHHIPFRIGDTDFSSRVTAAMDAKSDLGAEPFGVLVDLDGSRYTVIDKALGSDRPDHLFFLDGGVQAYRSYRVRQKLMLAGAKKPPCSQCGSE